MIDYSFVTLYSCLPLRMNSKIKVTKINKTKIMKEINTIRLRDSIPLILYNETDHLYQWKLSIELPIVEDWMPKEYKRWYYYQNHKFSNLTFKKKTIQSICAPTDLITSTCTKYKNIVKRKNAFMSWIFQNSYRKIQYIINFFSKKSH